MEHYLLFLKIISQRMSIHNHNTRSVSNILHIDYQRTNYGKFSAKYRRAKLWNNLPENLRNQKSYGQFKKTIKEYIQYHSQ